MDGELSPAAMEFVGPGQISKGFEHACVVATGFRVYRKHARGIADAQYLLSGQLPMYIARQGGKEAKILDMLFLVQVGLIEVGDGPSFRNGIIKEGAQLFSSLACHGISPGPEGSKLPALGIEWQIAMHHGTDP